MSSNNNLKWFKKNIKSGCNTAAMQIMDFALFDNPLSDLSKHLSNSVIQNILQEV